MRKKNKFTVKSPEGVTLASNLNARNVGELIGCTGANVYYHTKRASAPFNINGYTVIAKTYGGKAKVKNKSSGTKRKYKSNADVYTLVTPEHEVISGLTQTDISRIIPVSTSHLTSNASRFGYPFNVKGNMVHLSANFNGDTTITNGNSSFVRVKGESVSSKSKPKKSSTPATMSYTVVSPTGTVRENVSMVEAQQLLNGAGYVGSLPKGKLALPLKFNGFTVHDASVYDGSYRCSPSPKTKTKAKRKPNTKVKPQNVNVIEKIEHSDSPNKGVTQTVADLNMYTIMLTKNGIPENALFTQNISSVSKLSNCGIEVLKHHISNVGLPIKINECIIYDALSYNTNERESKEQPSPVEVSDKIIGDFTILDDTHGNIYSNLTMNELLSHGINTDVMGDLVERYGFPIGISGFTIFDNTTYDEWYDDNDVEVTEVGSTVLEPEPREFPPKGKGFWAKLFS